MSTDIAPPPSDREIGYLQADPTNGLPGLRNGLLPDWGTWDVDSQETVEALKWPNSVVTYDRMRSDPQIDALLRGLMQPIRRFRWEIDPNGARSVVAQQIAEDFGLPLVGEKSAPGNYRRNRFIHGEHLRMALLAYVYGHMFFEQVGTIESGLGGRLMWRLRKLAPRMPSSILEIKIARDGGLVWVKQKDEWAQEPIPITSLIAYVHEREGANWFGRSIMRSAYQPWVLKDRLLRVDAIRHERNGMGVPTIELPERATDAQRAEANKMAQQYKAGVASGGAIPYGMKLRLQGVEGQTSDVLASIRYHDEAMARLMLQTFTQFGSGNEHGSRAMADTMVRFFAKSQDTAADWYADTTTQHMIADMVEWNYGPDEQPPRLTYKRDEDPDLAAQEFAQLVAQGVLTVDEELEGFLRDRYGLPPLAPGVRKAPTQNLPPGTTDNDADPAFPPAPANASRGGLDDPTRFRRQMTEAEIKSGADFNSLHATWENNLRSAVAFWRPIRNEQISELVQSVRAASSITQIDTLVPTVRGIDELSAILTNVANAGVESALAEAYMQGVNLPRPTTPVMRPLAEATANLMARGLGSSASSIAVRSGPGQRGADALTNWAKSLSDSYLEEVLGGALTSAQNAGRFAVMELADPEPDLYASEIMDARTCASCKSVDGRQFSSLYDALLEYPTGGYINCQGGLRCRGTLVAIYGAGVPTVDFSE